MKKEDMTQFGYEIQGDEVVIHCHLNGSTFDTDAPVISNDVAYSWSVPVSEIEGMDDPTNYLKDAIVAANQ